MKNRVLMCILVIAAIGTGIGVYAIKASAINTPTEERKYVKDIADPAYAKTLTVEQKKMNDAINKQLNEEKADNLKQYEEYGLSYDVEQNQMYFSGLEVCYFADNRATDGTFEGMEVKSEHGNIGIIAVRDELGDLTGVKQLNEQELKILLSNGFDVYDKLGSQLDTEKKNLVYEQQIALCNKQAAERENAYQETRRVRHDLNGYLVDLKASIQSGRFEDAEAKIDNILSHNSLYGDEVSRSGNLVIDSLINYKYSLAQKEGIEMKCYVFVPETLDFDGADLCIILGNLLDNALEAVKNLPAEKGRIELSMSQVKGSLSIVVKNPYEGKILEDRNGQLLTNKPDKKNHGIGLDSVRRAVGRYNGELLTEYGNGMFRATVLLYPRENLHDYS